MEAGEQPTPISGARQGQTSGRPGPTTAPNPQDVNSIYEAISRYPFDSDAEFQAGLSSILGHPGTAATQAEQETKADLVLKAQCFYYARKFNTTSPIDPEAYTAWKANTNTSLGDDSSKNSTAEKNAPAPAPAPQPPPYPTSFAAIVELITNNQPIPGIEEVPDTVLELGSSKQDTLTRRRKPWEKDDAQVSPTPAPSARLQDAAREPSQEVQDSGETVDNGDTESQVDRIHNIRRTGVGVMHLLSPDAVPDSGLVAKN